MADAAFDGEANGAGGFAVGGVGVLAVFFLEAVDIHGAEAAMDRGHDADIFRQAHGGFTDATVNFSVEVLGALAGEVDIGLAGADIQFQAR